jgi:hypothetical protein
MALKDLSENEQELALNCLKAIAEGDEIEDWEFQTRIGVTRPIVKQIISLWPDIDDHSENSDEFLAINNCMNEICHGIPITATEWARWFAQPKESVLQAYSTWLRCGGFKGGLR